MDKVKIGLPRALFYYDEGEFLELFLEELGYDVLVSPKTDSEIKGLGEYYSNDEMCSSLKMFLGHIAYLKDRCDLIINVRFDNKGLLNQGCTNYLCTSELIRNIFEKDIINIDIDELNKKTRYKSLYSEFIKFGFDKKQIKHAYLFADIKANKNKKKNIIENTNKLNSDKVKVLLVGRAYNLYDEYIGVPISKLLIDKDIEVLYSNLFDYKEAMIMSQNVSKKLYWEQSRECVGAVEIAKNRIEGIIFLSSFPCGPDSLVNELLFRRLSLPYLNIVVDDLNSLTGIETRIESFIDIIGSGI